MTLRSILRCAGAVIAAIAVTFILVIAVEIFSAIVHPVPENFDGSVEEMCEHVARYPHWVLAVVVPMWGAIAFVGTWIAGRVGNRPCAILIGVLLLAAVVWNVAMLPYPLWFKLVQPVVVGIAVVYGVITSAHRGGNTVVVAELPT
jgi:hypothetical protein